MLRQVTTHYGVIRGIPAADPRITAFKGIPFAAPPVGALRWRAPQPPAPWKDVLEAEMFAPISMQEIPGLNAPDDIYTKEWHVDPDIPMSEDCLYLNIWSPARNTSEKLPVMIWIFGGGMCCGYPSEMEFDGERIARRGVILVSVNYRVNGFGFLAHPELTQESEFHSSGNYGFLDQLAAIKWVKENISAFGGDPKNMTVFGQSAGGRSVLCHLSSPLAKDTFVRAISQSAGGAGLCCRPLYPSLREAEETGKRFLSFLKVDSIAQARQIDACTLRDKSMEFILHDVRWGPVIDGWYLKEDPILSIAAGRLNTFQCMTGSTTAEMNRFLHFNSRTELDAYAKESFGENADTFLSLAKSRMSQGEKGFHFSYNLSELGAKTWAALAAEQNHPLYIYRFDADLPGDNAGAFHSSELWFIFETLAKCWRPFQGKHYDLARQMCNYWTNFAKTGNPNGEDNNKDPLPLWKPYTADSENCMHFGDVPQMEDTGQSPFMKFMIRQQVAEAKNALIKKGSR